MTHRCLTSLVMLNGVDVVPSNSNSPVMIKKKAGICFVHFFVRSVKKA